jgi:GNAT superfamily N-acetyltransferase
MPEMTSGETADIGPDSPSDRSAADGGRERRLVTRTFLELTALEQLSEGKPPALPATLEWIDPCPTPRWRALYRQIGAPWHWHDRDAWEDHRLDAHLARSEVRVFRVAAAAPTNTPAPADAGFLELEKHADGSVEIAYIGLDRAWLGHGLGAWLVTQAVRTAFAWGATRVWLHTCTLDAPAALPNYRARGFIITGDEVYFTTIAEP